MFLKLPIAQLKHSQCLANENRINKSAKSPLFNNLMENKESKADVIV